MKLVGKINLKMWKERNRRLFKGERGTLAGLNSAVESGGEVV